jgi:hypothetical protein
MHIGCLMLAISTAQRSGNTLKKSVLIVLLIAEIVFIGCVIRSKLDRHPVATRGAAAAAPKRDGAQELLNLDRNAPIHLDEARIIRLVSTRKGQELICSMALDEVSMDSLERALIEQDQIEPWCIKVVAERLDNQLISEDLAKRYSSGKQRPAREKHPVEIDLLKKHPKEVSAFARERYSLGTKNADTNVLLLLDALQLRTSCEDIRASQESMQRTGDVLYLAFEETYSKLCR